MEGERGVIIALQGHPSTGKTTIANILGRALKCTTFHLDNILEFVAPGPKPPRSTKIDAIFIQTFDLLTKFVRTQTRLGMSVVVDSPLSRLSHLDKLIEIVTGKDQEGGKAAAVRLIIVQCIPETEYMWETKLRGHIGSRYKDKCYKPQTFPIGKAYSRNYKDNDIFARLVSSLVVRTSSYVDVPPPDPLVVVVRRLMTSQKIQHKNLYTWMKKHDVSPLNYKRSRKWENLDGESSPDEGRPHKKAKVLRGWCTDRHCLKEHHEVGTYRIISGTCVVCDEKIIDSEDIYSCSDCPMAIHEACAELHGKGQRWSIVPKTSQNFYTRKCTKQPIVFPRNTCVASARKKERSSLMIVDRASSSPISRTGCFPPFYEVTRRIPITGFTFGSGRSPWLTATSVTLVGSSPTSSASLAQTAASIITPSALCCLNFSKITNMEATSMISAWNF